MANQEQVDRLRQGTQEWNRWRQENPRERIELRGVKIICANLSGANLKNADLKNINLRGSNLSGANLTNTNLTNANLSGGNLGGANLDSAKLDGANVSNANFVTADLGRANLSRANFSHANLGFANLSFANLSFANLSFANLTAAQVLNTRLYKTVLTGACIQDWNINSRTNLQDAVCEYIFTERDWQNEVFIFTNRRPHDPNQIFAPGEFTKRYQIVLETVDLFFNDGIDWKAFLSSLHNLQNEYGREVGVQGIEKKSGGSFVVRLEVPSNVDKGTIERQARELYQEQLQLLEAQYHAQLQLKDKEIESYRRESANMMEITKLLASRPITVEATAVAASQSDSETYNTDLRGATVGNFANKMQDNAQQQTNQYNYASPEKQSLAEAAQEIQKLLKILEQTNPTATEAEQKAFVTAAVPVTLRQRAASALQSGGKAAIEEFVDNPYLNVAIAIIEGWREVGQ